jgi:hypothetical protein
MVFKIDWHGSQDGGWVLKSLLLGSGTGEGDVKGLLGSSQVSQALPLLQPFSGHLQRLLHIPGLVSLGGLFVAVP